jgi:alpha-ribazole phosphatase
MEFTMKLTLVRHTTLQVPEGVCYGQSDIDVAASFHQELAGLQTKLNGLAFDAVYTSPLQRCSKLSLAITKNLGIGEVKYDNRLKELHFGDWELQAWDDIPRDIFDHWAQNYASLSPPNGETFTQLQQRGVEFLTEVTALHANQHLLVVTHGGMIRAMIAHVLNMQLKGLFRINVAYASVTQLDFSGPIPKVEFVNR